MAVFGVQLVITMVMASFLQKLSSNFSFARWFLSYRLVRYLHPTNEELKTVAGVKDSSRGKGKKGRDRFSDQNKDPEFLVPKNLQMVLDSAVVQPVELFQLHFYTEYQWLLDFSVCAIFVYFVTELYYFLLAPSDEINLSMLWCMLVIGFSLKVLFSVTALYFSGEEALGERSLCLMAGLFFFVVAMAVLITDENILEFGLDAAYTSFNESAYTFLENQGLNSSGPTSQLMFKLMLAVWCGFIGAFFTFPGFRFARMHQDSLTYCDGSPVQKLILHLSFLSPMLVTLLWVKPISRDYLTQKTWPGMKETIMTPSMFETTRIVVIVVVVIFRFILMPRYLQSYLNLAPQKLEKLRKEAGRISNIDLQRMVARIFYYLCVVTLQYLAPLLLCLFTTFLLKTLGEYQWSSYFSLVLEGEGRSSKPSVKQATERLSHTDNDSILGTSQQISLAMTSLKQIFTPVLYRGVFGFMTWWLCTVWFTTSVIGLIYHSYFLN
ncbi:transmembrane protein 161-like emei isoform X1 [Tachypleus tridentatus]|uniref:transmembrane protein 161-like emei isoform X1 n=2 Tax=Tachypleus tridentatus TaxID=6853 RepID=UPI003FCF1367